MIYTGISFGLASETIAVKYDQIGWTDSAQSSRD